MNTVTKVSFQCSINADPGAFYAAIFIRYPG